MIITKGNDKFIMVDISPKEMSTIHDAFQNSRFYMSELLKLSDKELSKSLGSNADPGKLRDVLTDKIKFYEKHLKKIMSYAQ